MQEEDIFPESYISSDTYLGGDTYFGGDHDEVFHRAAETPMPASMSQPPKMSPPKLGLSTAPVMMSAPQQRPAGWSYWWHGNHSADVALALAYGSPPPYGFNYVPNQVHTNPCSRVVSHDQPQLTFSPALYEQYPFYTKAYTPPVVKYEIPIMHDLPDDADAPAGYDAWGVDYKDSFRDRYAHGSKLPPSRYLGFKSPPMVSNRMPRGDPNSRVRWYGR
eukprot:gnl/MRDRNA2_/MRDRNA2_110828_c0_seq1.p1 gnl/MRDRNA2_/MRDRNA2_110828_c0~~gnl/MRDRNA2_/MRDRNA2_110828_c0_seq1.p1  ORF type:complete len:219 (+),score=19.77 gnl/MRDRNA2_/MRDRNA2_110828_c0_seq1:118-774(+)